MKYKDCLIVCEGIFLTPIIFLLADSDFKCIQIIIWKLCNQKHIEENTEEL